jgi:hypothetical protein
VISPNPSSPRFFTIMLDASIASTRSDASSSGWV